jgi:hypothetical protein
LMDHVRTRKQLAANADYATGTRCDVGGEYDRVDVIRLLQPILFLRPQSSVWQADPIEGRAAGK